MKLWDAKDGTSNTILVVHATECRGRLAARQVRPKALPKFGHERQMSEFDVLMADGSVRSCRRTSPNTLRAMITRSEGEAEGW